MSAPQNVVADLATFAQRGQVAASDVFESWTSTVQTVSDAAGTQASSFRRLARGMFDLADQAVVIERELATFLTVNAQVSAAALDTFRKLTDTATGAIEDVVRASTWGR
jgi:polyisoprenoid-binding protein YceI